MIQDIYLGAAPNDKTGTPARQAGQIINANFAYLDAKISNVNEIIAQTGHLKVGQDLTYYADWVWKINGAVYTNPVDVVTIIPFTSTGKERFDLFALNTSNTFLRIEGTETDPGIVDIPDLPIDMIQAGIVKVTDSSVGDPTSPIVGGDYVEKSEYSELFVPSTELGHITHYGFNSVASGIRWNGSETHIDGVSIYSDYKAYTGKIFTLKNFQTTEIIIKHLAVNPANNTQFWFPNEQDYVLKPGQIIEFSYSFRTLCFEFIGDATDLATKADLVSGKVPASQLPSYVDDILEGYLLSNVFYVESSHTTVIPAETGKIYIDITTGQKNKEYRYSGSTYIQITNGLIASTDDVPEGSNLYFTTARVLATLLTGISFATGGAIVSTDSVLVAFGKIQKQITDGFTTSNIRSLLGITTLSGSNTGDETTATLKTKFDVELAYALSDETSNLTVGNLISFRMPYAMTLSDVRISVNDAPTLSSLIVDVKEAGASIFSTLLSIDASELTSVTAATPAVVSDVNLADDALITVSTTQIGSGNTGKGLKIVFKGKKA
ncbi:hypothetical protein [Flavobacterium sp. WC2509]|uniref:hypothetical protein n=1 Tax=Flavobacterium sp. WC2509 TaxID=3461406 RepID=UPI004044D3A4